MFYLFEFMFTYFYEATINNEFLTTIQHTSHLAQDNPIQPTPTPRPAPAPPYPTQVNECFLPGAGVSLQLEITMINHLPPYTFSSNVNVLICSWFWL